MAVEVKRKAMGAESVADSNPNIILKYGIIGAADYDSALAALASETDATIGTYIRIRRAVTETLGQDGAPEKNRWDGEVEYAPPGSAPYTPPEVGDEEIISFQTIGGSQKITEAVADIANYKAAGYADAPDVKLAINATENGVEGIDIPVGQFSWQETHFLEDVTQTYIRDVLTLGSYRVNNASWRGYGQRNVLFMGATGSRRSPDAPFEVTYSFAAQPTLSNISIGDITVTEKKGWDYVWVRYEMIEIEDGGETIFLIPRPIHAYVQQVYREFDFSLLDID